MRHQSTLGITLAIALAAPVLAADLHVPADYPTIQDAIDAAVDGVDVVVIASGTYNEAITIDKDLIVRSADVDPTSVTIDAFGLGTRPVTMMGGLTENAMLIGVTLTGGSTTDGGGGLRITGESSPTIRRVIIADNIGATGGGISINGGSPTLSHVIVVGNETIPGAGGGVYVSDAAAELINCLIVDNDPAIGNGAMFAFDSDVTITNSIIGFNHGTAEIGANGGSMNVTYSFVEGGYAGVGNIDADPTFEDFAGRDFRLKEGSPCVNAGDNSALSILELEDIAGLPRYAHDPHSPNTGVGTGPLVDIGPHERRPGVAYVDVDAAGIADGSSWDDAYTDLGFAIAGIWSDDHVTQLWVAEGTYKPDFGTGDRYSSFAMRNNLTIAGGFDGTELFVNERDTTLHRPVLSGAIGVNGDPTDNTYHVVRATGVDQSARLTGFIIQKGYADGTDGEGPGGALLVDAAAPVFHDVWFRQNEATGASGSAIKVRNGAAPTFRRCRVNRNEGYGAAISVELAAATFVNTIIGGNIGTIGGGGLYADDADVTMTNCTVYGNESVNVNYYNGGVQLNESFLTISNSIVWGNIAPNNTVQVHNFYTTFSSVTMNNTTIEGNCFNAWGGVGNNCYDPGFPDIDGADEVLGTPDDDITLGMNSHAIDSGDNTLINAGSNEDFEGNERFLNTVGMPDSGTGPGPIVDRGAFEYQGIGCAYDCNGDGTVDVSDLIDLLAVWGDTGGDPTCDYFTAGGDGIVDVSELIGMLGMWGPCP